MRLSLGAQHELSVGLPKRFYAQSSVRGGSGLFRTGRAGSAFDAEGRLDHARLEAEDEHGEVSEPPTLSPTEQTLMEAWQRILKRTKIRKNENFFDLGGSSLLAAELIATIDSAFGVRFSFASVMSTPTIEALSQAIDGTRQGDRVPKSRHLVPLQTRGQLPPFFGMHPLFGLVYPYAELARQLKPPRPFYGLQARGFSRGEAPHRTVPEMAAAYIDAMRQVQPSGPYYIGGWSLGSLIAIEVAQQLEAVGEKIGCLVIIDQATDSLERFMEGVPYWVQLQRFGSILAAAMKSHDPEFGRHPGLLNALRRPRRLLRFCREVLFPMLKIAWANRAAAYSYVLRPYSGKIVLLHTGDPEFTKIEDARLGWDAIAQGGVEVYRISGSHLDLHEPPHVYRLAEQLSEALATAQVGAGH